MKLSWLFGRNVKTPGILYVDIEGIAFTPKGAEAVVKNLRSRNQELEETNRRLVKEVVKMRNYVQAAEETTWRKVPIN